MVSGNRTVELVAQPLAIGVRLGPEQEIGRKHATATEETCQEPLNTAALVRRAMRAGQVEPDVGSFGSSSSVGTAFSCSFHTRPWALDRFKNIERKLPNSQFRFVIDEVSHGIGPPVASRSVGRAPEFRPSISMARTFAPKALAT
ncbi:hypothetical protein BRC77_04700 [Halobacteriales archaeon QH_8_64_26]|nr:MAG: hypothetical protein BRC77_04700 [Halobacteriales archaeon QH_8_64_26]